MCDKHFLQEDHNIIQKTKRYGQRLSKTAIPSLFCDLSETIPEVSNSNSSSLDILANVCAEQNETDGLALLASACEQHTMETSDVGIQCTRSYDVSKKLSDAKNKITILTGWM